MIQNECPTLVIVSINRPSGKAEVILRANSNLQEISEKVFNTGEFKVDIKDEILSFLEQKLKEARTSMGIITE